MHSLLSLNESWLHLGCSHKGCISKLYFPIPAAENIDKVSSICTVRSCYGEHCPGGWGVSYSSFTFLAHSRESVTCQTFIIRVTDEWVGREPEVPQLLKTRGTQRHTFTQKLDTQVSHSAWPDFAARHCSLPPVCSQNLLSSTIEEGVRKSLGQL